jgi:HAD superfamily hydrolase (TIGR01490 family)
MIMPSTALNTTCVSKSSRRLAAFFDVDNTLIPGVAIEVRFFGYLLKRGVVGMTEALRSVGYLVRHLPPVSLHPLRERKLYLEGKQPATIEPIAEEFVRSHILHKLAWEGLATLERHRSEGHRLVLITGSLDFLIAPLAKELGIDCVLAAQPERTESGYTGRVVPPLPYGEGKRHLVERFAKQEQMELKDCYAYGDSPGDFAVLQCVGYPQVVNPIRGMARVARSRGWPIVKWI